MGQDTDPQTVDWTSITWELTEAAKAFDAAKRVLESATVQFASVKQRLQLAKQAHESALKQVGAMLDEASEDQH